MPKTAFMPHDDTGKAKLLVHFAITLPKYQGTFEISNEDMNTLKSDATSFPFANDMQNQVQSFAHNWTSFKNQLRDGGSGDINWPVAPDFSANLPPVSAPGVIQRLSTLIAGIKAHKNYTDAIGQDLQIVGAQIVLDPVSWKPVLTVQYNAGHLVIGWKKGQAAAIEIHADRGDGNGFTFFVINIEPDTIDNTPLPVSGAGVNWQYKAIYLLHDERVGQWSDVVSIKAVS
ncbi:MAG: hypothetical protein WCK93_12785 [Nitrosomonadales bacterium]